MAGKSSTLRGHTMTADLAARVRAMRWHHSIDLGGGVVTPGMADRFPALEQSLPDMRGRTVLDVGAWDGYWSFLAERRGAARVVALDHYVWGVDLVERNAYWADCARRGVLPDQARDAVDFWHDDLPGRRGFELARETLGSRVEPVVADFMATDLAALGRFDVVLYLGVLYHMPEPLTALQRLRAVTGDVAVIETEAIHVPGHRDDTLLRFYTADELHADFGNWFATSEAALHGMCRAAGFARVETRVGPPRAPSAVHGWRALARAAKHRVTPPAEGIARYRLVVHAFTA